MIEALQEQDREIIRARINSETAKIPWQELQRFFAGGNTLYVSAGLDLVEVALAFQQDQVDRVKGWTDEGLVVGVSDDQARQWSQEDASLWAVVVKPWVLIQETRG